MKRLGRWLFNLAAGVSLLMCMATVSIWAGGGCATHEFRVLPATKDWWYLVEGKWLGMIQFIVVHATPKPIVGPPITPTHTSPAELAWNSSTIRRKYFFNFLGLSLSQWAEYGNESDNNVNFGKRWDLDVRYWALIAILMILPIYVWILPPAAARVKGWREERLRRRIGLCPVCGYDLRATPDRCPECGTIVQAQILLLWPFDLSCLLLLGLAAPLAGRGKVRCSPCPASGAAKRHHHAQDVKNVASGCNLLPRLLPFFSHAASAR